MKRITGTVIAGLLALGTVRAAAGDVSVLFKGGYFRPSDATFKQIYGPGAIFSLEINAGISKNFAVWVEGSRFSRTGMLTLTGEPTWLWLIPMGAGLRFTLPAGPLQFYVGAGGGYFKLVETNRIGTVIPGRLGAIATAGVLFQAPGGWIIDAGLKYSLCRMRPAEFAFDVGGLEAGLGVGYRIPQGALTRESGGEKKVEFALSLGVKQRTRENAFSHFGASLWLGGNVDLHLGRSLMISPEVVIEPASFGKVTPGATLNYEIGDGFVGGGLVIPIILSGGNSGFDRIAPKINFGYRAGHLRLAAEFTFTRGTVDAGLGIGYQGLAQEPGRVQKKKMEFSLNAGLATNLGGGESFEVLLFSLGGQLDIDLGGKFLLSPELLLYSTLTDFSGAVFMPGALVNYKLGRFFVGAGPAFVLGFNEDSGFYLYPKFNVGYRGEHMTLTGYLVTSFSYFFPAGLAGASIGFRL